VKVEILRKRPADTTGKILDFPNTRPCALQLTPSLGTRADQLKPKPSTPNLTNNHHLLTNASEGYMARSRRTPPMKDHWRAEEEARDRAAPRYRDSNRSERRPRTPPFIRREDSEDRYRGPDSRAAESYRPSSNREAGRASKHPRPRKASPSPRRASKPTPPSPQRSRGLEDRTARPRDRSPTKPPKRRRTRSPSPARSDRYLPPRRRDSRSRDRSEPRDRRPVGADRTFSSRRSSLSRDARSGRRSQIPSSDSYVPSHRRRERSRSRSRSPPRHFDRRSRSPRRRSRSPPTRISPAGHHRKRKPDISERELSPYSARALKTQKLSQASEPWTSETMNHPQRIQSIVDNPSLSTQGQNYQGGGHDMMGNHAPVRGNFGGHNSNMIHHNRPPRPMVDTRSSYQGSPPFMTPNSSYHGSPQSGSPFHGNRGGWSNQQFQGHQG
jgi:CTD kinase subunit alpha